MTGCYPAFRRQFCECFKNNWRLAVPGRQHRFAGTQENIISTVLLRRGGAFSDCVSSNSQRQFLDVYLYSFYSWWKGSALTLV